MKDPGWIRSLFDFSFSYFVTPKIQRVLYGIFLVISGLGALLVFFGMLMAAPGVFAKLGALLIGIPLAALAFLVMAMYFRVISELVVVAFRGVEHLRDISAAMSPTTENRRTSLGVE